MVPPGEEKVRKLACGFLTISFYRPPNSLLEAVETEAPSRGRAGTLVTASKRRVRDDQWSLKIGLASVPGCANLVLRLIIRGSLSLSLRFHRNEAERQRVSH